MVTTVAPAVAAGSAQLIGSQVAMKQGSGTGASAEDNADKCDQLLRAPLGVEEVRKNKDGVIESRQWKIAETSGDPIWIVARTQSEDSPKNAWQPKPGITKLLFNPPLNEDAQARQAGVSRLRSQPMSSTCPTASSLTR